VRIFVPIIAAACLTAGSIGCGEKQVAGPPPSPDPQSPAQPTTVTGFPALTKPGTIYGEQGQLYAFFSPSQGRLVSRYVIYDDGSFELDFMSETRGFFSYAGTYTASGTGLALNFSDSDSAGPWTAMGSLSGDQMGVKYNGVMIGADFNDGTYVRVPPK
jgi:hypothetical protein